MKVGWRALPRGEGGRKPGASAPSTSRIRSSLPVAVLAGIVLVLGLGENGKTLSDSLTLQIAIGLAFLLYLVGLIIARRMPRPLITDYVVAGLVVAYVLGAIFSLNWRVSGQAVMIIAAPLLAYRLAADGPFRLMDVVHAVMLVGGILAVSGLVQEVVGVTETVQLRLSVHPEADLAAMAPLIVQRAQGITQHPNVLAMWLVLFGPLLLGKFLKDRSRWAAFGLALVGTALILTLSRGGWLGALGSLLLLGLASRRIRRGALVSSSPQRRRWLRPIVAAAVATSAGLVYEALRFRPGWLFRATLGARVTTVQAGIRMVADHPLTGVGPHMFPLVVDQYIGDELFSGGGRAALLHSHNQLVQLGVESGVLGLAVIALGLLLTTRLAAKRWLHVDETMKWIVVAASAALAGSLVHGLFDVPSVWLGPSVGIGVVLGIGGRALGGVTTFRKTSGFLAAVLSALPLLLLILWVTTNRGLASYERGLELQSRSEYAGAIDGYAGAVDADPHMAVYFYAAGANAAQTEFTEGLDPLDYLETSVSLSPSDALFWTGLAQLRLREGDLSGARSAALEAVQTTAGDQILLALIGSVLDSSGRQGAADLAYWRAVRVDPSVLATGFWDLTVHRRSMRPALLAGVLSEDPCRWGATLAAVMSKLALRNTLASCETALGEGSRQLLSADRGRILLELGQLDEAELVAASILTRRPDDQKALGLAGDVAGRRGLIVEARDFWARDGGLGSIADLIESYASGEVPEAVVARGLSLLQSAEPIALSGNRFVYRLGAERIVLRYDRDAPQPLLFGDEWLTLLNPDARRIVEALGLHVEIGPGEN